MSRKTILGRASLSFLTTDGVLDMDQILQTDPWTQIDNFVQHNFVQNVLDEFNERITLDPKLTPADKSPGKKRATSSGRSPRKSQTDRTDGEKSSEGKETDRPAGDDPEDKKEIAKKSNKRTEGPKGKVTKNGDANKQKEERAKIPKTGNSGKRKTKDETNKTEESTDTQQLEGTQKTTGKKTPTAKSERKKTVRKRKDGEEKEEAGETKVVEPTNDKTNTTPEKTITANTSKSKDSKSPIVTSTPKCKSPRLTNSWHDASTLKKDSSVLSNDVSKHCAGDSYVEYTYCADINNNYFELVAQSNSSKITDTKCKRKTTGKTKEGKNPGNKETSMNEKKDSSAENKETTMDEGEKSKCKKQNEKTATKKTDSLASNNTSSRKKCAKDISATKDSKDDHDETVAEKTKVKREHKTGEKMKREKKSGDKEASGISTDKKPKSKCKKQDNKKIEGKQIGRFEKRLLKHRERHIRRHERKAERAMEEFSHHVTRIVKKMGHLPVSCRMFVLQHRR
ncbi:hypothetical protein K0M31_019415 [Melipona bicolor]|uniref:Uncharacterized protein n=1 Tax=Melipona bicolor TaxID=60889 RepID=A0AA40G2C8_9HYME|nr:hypothetical protein K0M31_019415 [Melipona bicolor]